MWGLSVPEKTRCNSLISCCKKLLPNTIAHQLSFLNGTSTCNMSQHASTLIKKKSVWCRQYNFLHYFLPLLFYFSSYHKTYKLWMVRKKTLIFEDAMRKKYLNSSCVKLSSALLKINKHLLLLAVSEERYIRREQLKFP